MGFWIFLLIMNLLIPFTMIGFGRRFLKSAPRKINLVFGYRTARSMKNRKTWEYAHKVCGRIWFYGGLILLPATVLTMLFLLDKEEDTVGYIGAAITLLQVLVLTLSILPVERALKKKFDRNGLEQK